MFQSVSVNVNIEGEIAASVGSSSDNVKTTFDDIGSESVTSKLSVVPVSETTNSVLETLISGGHTCAGASPNGKTPLSICSFNGFSYINVPSDLTIVKAIFALYPLSNSKLTDLKSPLFSPEVAKVNTPLVTEP